MLIFFNDLLKIFCLELKNSKSSKNSWPSTCLPDNHPKPKSDGDSLFFSVQFPKCPEVASSLIDRGEKPEWGCTKEDFTGHTSE